MTTTNNEASGAGNNDKSKIPAGGGAEGAGGSNGGTKTYSEEYVQRLLDQKKAADRENADLKGKIEARENQDLTNQKKFEELYTKAQAKVSELEGKLSARDKADLTAKKRDAVQKSLFTLGLEPSYLDDALKILDVESLKIDEATMTVVGVEEAAKSFHTKYQKLGFFKNAPTKIANHEAPGSGSPKVVAGVDVSNIKSADDAMKALRENEARLKKA